MKKIIKFLISLLLVFSFTSCDNMKDEEKFMLKGNVENTQLIDINGLELKEMIELEESFVLVILLNGCSSCQFLKENIINPYINETKANIYGINTLQLDELERFDNKPTYKIAPTIVIYNSGKIVDTLSYDIKNDVFNKKEVFKAYLDKYCIEPRLIELSEQKVDLKLENKDSFILYVGWNKCGDCKLFDSEVLDKYLKDNEVTIYYLECDKYRSKKPAVEPILSANPTAEELLEKENWNNWISFASKYGFVSYESGKVPAVIYYENGLVKDYIVYRNDKIENELVINSFYKELVNKSYTGEQLLEFHNNKAIEFLNRYSK